MKNDNIQSENDSIIVIDTLQLTSPYPPTFGRDSLIRKKYHKKDLSMEYVIRSRNEKSSTDKFWYLNRAIELDSLNAEAYYERGILKTLLESTFPPVSGCTDICRAKNLGYSIPQGQSVLPKCNCNE